MAALKPNEQRLMAALGGMLFLAVNLFAWSYLQGRDQRAAVEEVRLRSDIKRMQGLQAQFPEAEKHDKVLAQYLKRYDNINTRDTYLGTFVQQEADALNLRLAKNAPTRTEGLDEPDADFIKSGYNAEVSGDRKSVLTFIHRLHNPSEFRLVKRVNVAVRKSEQQDGISELVCNFELQKWWHPASEELLEEPAAPLAESPAEQSGAAGVRPDGVAAPQDAPDAAAPPATVRAEPNPKPPVSP